MERIDVPFNISLLHLTPQKLRGLGRITALDPMEGSSKDFHPAGLFSVDFFGRVGDERRTRRYAFIDIKIPVFHPLVHATLVKLKNLYGGIMSGTDYALWDKTSTILFVHHLWKVKLVFPSSLNTGNKSSSMRKQRVCVVFTLTSSRRPKNKQ